MIKDKFEDLMIMFFQELLELLGHIIILQEVKIQSTVKKDIIIEMRRKLLIWILEIIDKIQLIFLT